MTLIFLSNFSHLVLSPPLLGIFPSEALSYYFLASAHIFDDAKVFASWKC